MAARDTGQVEPDARFGRAPQNRLGICERHTMLSPYQPAIPGARRTSRRCSEQFLERSLIILIRGGDSAVRLLLPESSLGMAQSTPDQRGRVAFIYWNRVQKVAIKYLNYRVLVEKMLALAMAHEIGHLLLPKRALE
jgi:hypothetical protein